MPTLWGSKRKDIDADQEQQDDTMTRDSEEIRREPTERDRLLPASNLNPPHADGYLDPDDPAVSPYNLWTVRFTRYISILFLCVTFVWWTLLLVSIFVSPPGLHTRGSGFFDFSYTTLTLGLLLNSLLFFSAPSLAMRATQGVLGLILFIDLIIIVSVTRVRAEEGPPGIASVVWAVLMAGWCIITDRVVAWGKAEEEERLTGRPESRRTLKEWLAVMTATTILVVYIVVSILMTATLIIRSVDAGLEFTGDRIAIDGGKFDVHLACHGNITEHKGERTPTVLLEGGEWPLEYTFGEWLYNARKNGTISRYCYWDRPGYAWSDNAPSPHSAGMAADNLAEALAIKGEEGPWILVSAGYGSVVSRIFASRNDQDVAGIMLVDPLHEDLLHRIASPMRGFRLWGYGILSPLGVTRIFGSLFQGQTKEDRVFGRDALQGGKLIKAHLQENLLASSLTRSELQTARKIQKNSAAPLVVVSSGIRVRTDAEWSDKQRDLTTITTNLLAWDVVNKAPHQVWETLEGREAMEKRLGELMKQDYKPKEHVLTEE